MIRGSLSPSEAGIAMSRVGEAAINAVLWKVSENFTEKYGSLNDGGVAVVVSGNLASEPDTTLNTQLDIYFVYSSDQNEYCESMCRQFLKEIQSYLRDNILFAPTLADDGQDTVHPLVSFAKQHRYSESNRTSTLIRSRCINAFGRSDFRARFDRMWHEITAYQDSSQYTEMSTFANSSRHMIDAWLHANETNGSPTEYVEQAAVILRLNHAKQLQQVLHPDVVTVFRSAAENNLISKDASEQLIEAATMSRNLAGILSLVADDDFMTETTDLNVKSVIARACGLDNFDELDNAISNVVMRSKSALETLNIAYD